ncbi:MAG: type II toxin-antitoxin system VapC family toxin [Thermoanaerobaculia bacterium]|nr:type II toxin-antitoxin system VapC family toxin [Thermoanaerobaculia bacterium]
MIAIDTNLLVRLIVEDDPAQAARARALLEAAVADGEPCFLSDPVLCELEWVLESCYDATRQDILLALQDLMACQPFLFEDRDALRRALDAYQKGKADFSDYLIGAKAAIHGAWTTYTFDRALRQTEGFTHLRPAP